MRLVCALLAVASLSNGLKAQSCSTFDVASIKPNSSNIGGGPPELAPGGRRFTAPRQYMVELIMFVWDVSPLQISGIPSDISRQTYDVEATCEQPMTKEQLPHMVQLLLADRFHLAVHRELKEQPVYVLLLGKSGPKLHETLHPDAKPVFRQNGHTFTFTNSAMSDLVGVLSQVAGRKVLDRTGLTGQYDFTLSYAPDSDSPSADSAPDSVFTAVRDLGLNLDPQKAPIEFIVVDRLDRLIPN